MANKLYEESNIQAIANAIRAKGQTGTMTVAQMPSEIGAIQTGIEPQAYEWQQSPVPVQRYLDEVTYTFANPDVYSDADYASSQIATYTALGSGERPVGKTINFAEAGELNQGGYRKTVSAGNVTLYNDIPKIKTPYTLTVSGNGIKAVGTLKPTAWLRQINASVRNIRDIGGRPCYNSDGEIEGYIRYGKLFRGAEVYTQEDVDIFLDQLGIRAELDLQSEEAHTTHILSDQVDYCAPVVPGGQWIWYSLTHKEEIKTAFHFIFDSLKRNKPLFFHCIAGCDRTGTVACIIENLLGCSRSDIDKDFELSSWYASRLRTSSDWKNLQREIGALSGDSYRDKLVNFFATLGFTAAEINAFRAEMIEPTGTSIETVTPSIGTQTITNTLTHATNSNTATSITQYQPYEAKLTPDSGYVMDNVRITMGGADITSQVFKGTETNLYRKVTKALSHCSAKGKTALIDGQDFVCKLTADDGYTLDEEAGASIVITVGGQQVYPSGGIIPSDYQQVEWIGADGTQYINTGIVPSNISTLLKGKFEITQADTSNYLYGSGTSPRLAIAAHSNNISFSAYNPNNTEADIFSILVDRAETLNIPSFVNAIIEHELFYSSAESRYFKLTTNTHTCNITKEAGISSTFANYPICVLGWSYGSKMRYGIGRCYGFEIEIENAVVFNGIPCYRKTDNVIGLYDTVSKAFFTNSGTGTFTKGQNV